MDEKYEQLRENCKMNKQILLLLLVIVGVIFVATAPLLALLGVLFYVVYRQLAR
jgi:hypothetical protein